MIRQIENDYHVSSTRVDRMLKIARSWNTTAPITSFEWAVDGADLFVQHPDDDAWHGSRSLDPKWSVVEGTLNMNSIRSDVRRRLTRPETQAGHTERRRGVKSSREVFAGTGIPVDSVVAYITHGLDDEHILTSYPSLYQKDIDLARDRVSP